MLTAQFWIISCPFRLPATVTRPTSRSARILLIRLPVTMNSLQTMELSLPATWDQDIVMISDEELSATSHEEASKVFEQWQTDDHDHEMDIMEVDEQIGSTLLDEDIFPDPCDSPTGPLDELVYMNLGEQDIDRFSLSLLNEDDVESSDASDKDRTSSLPFEERYKATLQKLTESMSRSQETRKSLQMQTPKTVGYSRRKSVSGVLQSIEKSTQQLQVYLKKVDRV